MKAVCRVPRNPKIRSRKAYSIICDICHYFLSRAKNRKFGVFFFPSFAFLLRYGKDNIHQNRSKASILLFRCVSQHARTIITQEGKAHKHNLPTRSHMYKNLGIISFTCITQTSHNTNCKIVFRLRVGVKREASYDFVVYYVVTVYAVQRPDSSFLGRNHSHDT